MALYKPPSQPFSKLDPEAQKLIREILNQQGPIVRAPLTLAERDALVDQLITYIDFGYAKIEIINDAFIFKLAPTLAAAIRDQMGVDL